MKRIQFRRMLAVIARMAMVLILVTLPTNGAQGQASQSSANSPAVIGWYSYTDPDFGWTIQYPADWTTEVLFENPPAQAEGVIRRRLALYAPDRATIWVDSSDNPARQSAESWFRLYKQSLLSSNPSETVVQKALLNGLPAIFAVDSSDHTATAQVTVVAVRDTLAVEITYLVLDGGAARDQFATITRKFVWGTAKAPLSGAANATQLPVLTEGILPSRPVAANCCGINSPGNICVCCTRNSDGAEVGNCVWWACSDYH